MRVTAELGLVCGREQEVILVDVEVAIAVSSYTPAEAGGPEHEPVAEEIEFDAVLLFPVLVSDRMVMAAGEVVELSEGEHARVLDALRAGVR